MTQKVQHFENASFVNIKIKRELGFLVLTSKWSCQKPHRRWFPKDYVTEHLQVVHFHRGVFPFHPLKGQSFQGVVGAQGKEVNLIWLQMHKRYMWHNLSFLGRESSTILKRIQSTVSMSGPLLFKTVTNRIGAALWQYCQGEILWLRVRGVPQKCWGWSKTCWWRKQPQDCYKDRGRI